MLPFTALALLTALTPANAEPGSCGPGSREVLVQFQRARELWEAIGERGTTAFGAALVEQKLTEETLEAQAALLARLAPCPARAPLPLWLLGATAITLTEPERAAVAADPGVARVLPLGRRAHLLPGSAALPAPAGAEYTAGLARIGLPELRRQFPQLTGAGVRVGIIDTGIDAAHPDLAGRLALFRNFVSPSNPNPIDDHSHGTHVAGTIAGGGRSGTAVGVAPGASLIVAKAFGRYGGSDDKDLLAALQWMADPDGKPATPDGARIVSNSWNADNPDPNLGSGEEPFCQAAENLRRLGIAPVFAAGNDGPGARTIKPPGSCPAAFTVGATDDQDRLADFSSRGPSRWPDLELNKPDLSAPGVGVLSTVPGGGYGSKSGTSMATPHVAGALALLLQARPDMGVEDAMRALRDGSRDLGQPGTDPSFGAGRLDLVRAVQQLP